MNKPWIAAFNLPTRTWTSGGTLDAYDNEHYDIFVVPAASHDSAVRAARAIRQSQLRLTPSQRTFLASLVSALPAPIDPAASVRSLIEIEASEARVAAALQRKGLLSTFDPDTAQVKLSTAAFNPSILAMIAHEAAS